MSNLQPLANMATLDFSHFPQPESNDSNSVGAALDAVRAAHDESSANEACDQLLWALGNNHAGTFYPVVLAALPQIEQILIGGGVWAQHAVLEALIDLGGTFIPEAGYEVHRGVSVQKTLQAFVHAIRPRIEPLAQGAGACSRSARELLELIDDQAV